MGKTGQQMILQEQEATRAAIPAGMEGTCHKYYNPSCRGRRETLHRAPPAHSFSQPLLSFFSILFSPLMTEKNGFDCAGKKLELRRQNQLSTDGSRL